MKKGDVREVGKLVQVETLDQGETGIRTLRLEILEILWIDTQKRGIPT